MSQVAKKEARHRLIEEYQEYVHSVVGRMIRQMHLPSEMFDDFVAAGYLGLVEAAERFDFDSGADFRGFAFLRVRGAVIDSIRQCSEVSGRAYKYAKALRAVEEMRERFGTNTPIEEMQDLMTTEERLAEVLDFAARAALAFRISFTEYSAEEVNIVSEDPSPEDIFNSKQQRAQLRRYIENLSVKERIVIQAYYIEGKTISEIANEQDGMSKSWVSRLLTRAVGNLKNMYLEELACDQAA